MYELKVYIHFNNLFFICECRMAGSFLLSISRKLVLANMAQGEVVTDMRPRTLPNDDEFMHICSTVDKDS